MSYSLAVCTPCFSRIKFSPSHPVSRARSAQLMCFSLFYSCGKMPEKNNLLNGGFISTTNYCPWLASFVAFSTKGKQKPHSGKPLLSQWPGSREFIWGQGTAFRSTQKYTIAELIPPTSYFPLPRNNSFKL